jgi:hypothetical protein
MAPSDRDRDDFGRLACLLQPDRLLDADLVERVHRHFHVGEFDPGAVRLHPNFDVVVDDPLDGDEYLHAFAPAAARKLWLVCLTVNAGPQSMEQWTALLA